MAPPANATPTSITLRFKHHKSTTLLHADPLASFFVLKRELLRALHQTHPSGLLNSVAIPSDPLEVLLAQPRGGNNLASGWRRLRTDDEIEREELDDDDEEEAVKTPKKRNTATATKRRKTPDRPDSPKAAGLKDGGALAFKFKSESTAKNDVMAFEDDEDMIGDDEAEDQEQWDVVMPSYEDDAEGGSDDAGV